MTKRLLSALLVVLLAVGAAFAAKPRVVLGPGQGAGSFRLPYHQNFNRVLSKDTVYILTGWYFVDSTYSLTIPAGTLIYGDKPSAGSLIIKRGAKIIANGTAAQPIVFTSLQPAGSRAPGDWGGVIVLGKAPINQTEPEIEGGFSTIAGASAPYGGGGPGLGDPNDSSGVLRYMRIEWAGYAFAQDNEINGLTFGGVGAKTVVDHIQVSYANDDDVEFFGGTVQAKYILTMGNIDDNFDTDYGFSGKLQFVAAFRDSLIYDASASGQSNGNESDNMGSENGVLPLTSALVSNETLIGPMPDTTASVNLVRWGHLALLRRATAWKIYNSVLEGWPIGINIRDTLTQRNALNDLLQIRSTSIAGVKGSPVIAQGGTGKLAAFDPVAWFNTPAYNNNGGAARQASAVGLINPWKYGMAGGTWDPRPSPSSEAATAGTNFTGLDAWYTPVSYRGAFDPSLPMAQQWGGFSWTVLDPQTYDPEATTTVNVSYANSWNLVSVPVAPASYSASALFPTAINVYGYNGSAYASAPTLQNGEGYWMLFSGAGSQGVTGAPLHQATYAATTARWYLVGTPDHVVPVSALTTVPSGLAVNVYEYNGSAYVAPVGGNLQPGKAYWVLMSGPGTIIVGP